MSALVPIERGLTKLAGGGAGKLATDAKKELQRKSVGEVGSILGNQEAPHSSPRRMKYAGGNVKDHSAYGNTRASHEDDIIDAEWNEIPSTPPPPPSMHGTPPSGTNGKPSLLLEGNKKINDAWGFSAAYKSILNGIRNHADRRIMSSQEIRNKLRSDGRKSIASSADITDMDRLKSMYRNKDGSLNKTMLGGTIAGGIVGTSAVGRIATGGGLYRDSEGNFDVIGIPFI